MNRQDQKAFWWSSEYGMTWKWFEWWTTVIAVDCLIDCILVDCLKICNILDFMIQGYFQLFVYSFHFFWNWLLFLHDKYNFQCPALYFQVPQIVPTNLLEWMLMIPLSRMRKQSRLEWVQMEQTSLTLQLLLSMLGKWDMHLCHMIWKIVEFA